MFGCWMVGGGVGFGVGCFMLWFFVCFFFFFFPQDLGILIGALGSLVVMILFCAI